MLHIALCEPEIPPNTGNVGRLCVATGAALHLVGRLGFRLDARSLRRAGLDYWDLLDLRRHDTLESFENWWAEANPSGRLWCFSSHATTLYTRAGYRDGDGLLFGGESHGLPPGFLDRHAERALTIPMPTGRVRSLNLATAVGIALFEALRQLHAW